MAEWLYEDGIGERRAALIAGDRIVAAQVERDDDGPGVGAVLSARLITHDRPRRRARIRLDDDTEGWLANPPPTLTQGAAVLTEITRTALREAGRTKLAQAVLSAAAAPRAAPTLHDRLSATEHPVRTVSAASADDVLEAAGWSDLLDIARTGIWPFSGGALAIALTPAMTVIDVDGDLPPRDLAKAGAGAAAAAILALGLTGSIGIDFPTLAGRADRQSIDALLDAALPPPFERTAMNGFGFVQIIRRRMRPSLCERLQYDDVLSDALALLRIAERAVGAGMLTLTARASVIALLQARPQWIGTLQVRTGRAAVLTADDSLKGSGHAQ